MRLNQLDAPIRDGPVAVRGFERACLRQMAA
jgi:hypothetical protein